MAQRCNVETFEALVSTAHLRPMRGIAGFRIAAGPVGKPPAPRCFAPDGSITAPAATPAVPLGGATGGKSSGDEAALRSGALFMRAWRAAPAPAERRRLLARACAAGALPRLLRLELSSRLLEELLACLGGSDAGGAAAQPAAAAAVPDAGAEEAAEQATQGQQAEQQRQQAAAVSTAAAAAAEAAPLAAAVLEAAAGAAGFAVARAGLSLQGKQQLECLQAAVKQV